MREESNEKRLLDRIKFVKSLEPRLEKVNDISPDTSKTISKMDLSESEQLRRHFQGIEISQSDRDKIQNRLNKVERLERGRLEKDVSLNERTQIQKMLTASVDRIDNRGLWGLH